MEVENDDFSLALNIARERECTEEKDRHTYLSLLQKVVLSSGSSGEASGWAPNNGSLAKQNGITFDANGNIQRVGASSKEEDYLNTLSWISKSPPSDIDSKTRSRAASSVGNQINMAAGQATWESDADSEEEEKSSESLHTEQKSSDLGQDKRNQNKRHCSWLSAYSSGIVAIILLALATHCLIEHCMVPPTKDTLVWNPFQSFNGDAIQQIKSTTLDPFWHQCRRFFSFRSSDSLGSHNLRDSKQEDLATIIDSNPEFKRNLLQRIQHLEEKIEVIPQEADGSIAKSNKNDQNRIPSSSQIDRFGGVLKKQRNQFHPDPENRPTTLFSRIAEKLANWINKA